MSILFLLKSFKRRKTKVFLTVLAISIGVLSVVIISAVGSIGKNIIKNEMSALGLNGLVISKNIDLDTLTLSEYELKEIKSLKIVENASPLIYNTSTVTVNNKQSYCILFGADSKNNDTMKLSVVSGRPFYSQDITCANKVCLIDESFAISSFGSKNVVNKSLLITLGDSTQSFKIVGVINSKNSMVKNMLSQYTLNFIYLPYTTLMQFSQNENFDSITVELKDNATASLAETSLLKQLSFMSGIDDAYKIENMHKHSDSLNKILNVITLVLSLIAGVSLIVSGISVMTSMLSSVRERTHEIGIKKSIGARSVDIMVEFLFESFLISFFGLALGLCFGFLISFTSAFALNVKINFDINIIISCAIITLLSGVIFGVYPAVCACKLKPIDALKIQ